MTSTGATARAVSATARGVLGCHTENIEHAIDLNEINLRTVTIEDLDGYTRLLQDTVVMKYVGLKAGELLTEQDCEAIVTGAVNAWQTRGYGRWSIFDNETGEFIGFCGFRCEDGVPELISMIFKKYWGTGVARSAVEACIDYGFNNLGFTRVVSYTRPDNVRAKGLLDKLGADLLGSVDFHGVAGVAYEFIKPSPVQ
jgi:ribosomal-protein-alanine N-acetyltransferase